MPTPNSDQPTWTSSLAQASTPGFAISSKYNASSEKLFTDMFSGKGDDADSDDGDE